LKLIFKNGGHIAKPIWKCHNETPYALIYANKNVKMNKLKTKKKKKVTSLVDDIAVNY
jgi:hypothetical protein